MLRMFLVEFTSAKYDEFNLTTECAMLFAKVRKKFSLLKLQFSQSGSTKVVFVQ